MQSSKSGESQRLRRITIIREVKGKRKKEERKRKRKKNRKIIQVGGAECSQGVQLIEGLVVVRNKGEVGLAGGPEGGQEPGVMTSGEASSGF